MPSSIIWVQESKYEWMENPAFAISPTEVIVITRKYMINPVKPVNPQIPAMTPPIIDINVRLHKKKH